MKTIDYFAISSLNVKGVDLKRFSMCKFQFNNGNIDDVENLLNKLLKSTHKGFLKVVKKFLSRTLI